MSRRFFVHPLETGSITLSQEAAHHAKVLRLRAGDEIVLFDGRDSEAVAIIESSEPLRCRVESIESRASRDAPVVLIQGLPKGPALEEVIRSTTEAGVSAIHLAHTAHAVPRTKADRLDAKMERWQRIAQEAARQSERADVPPIVGPAGLLEVAERAPESATRLICSPRDGERFSSIERKTEVWAVVGPEGGLSESEETQLLASGWQRVRLATPILRVETAAPVVIAMLRDHLTGC